MKQKYRLLGMVICLAMLSFIMGCVGQNGNDSANNNENDREITGNMTDDKNTATAIFSYDNFIGKQEWKHGVLLGDGQILSFDTPLYCTDLEKGESRPLCSVFDCVHNNYEKCQAIFDDHYGSDFVYCYNGKIYGVGVVGNCIRIRCANPYENNHETVDYEVFAGDVYSEEYYVHEDVLYLSVSIENTEQEYLLQEDGSYMVYNHPAIYEFDFATGTLSLVYQDEKGGYSASIHNLYVLDGVLYFDEEANDGKLGALNLETKEVTTVEGYDASDYLGCKRDLYYYAESDEEGYLTGDVHVVNRRNNKEETIHLADLPRDEMLACGIHLLEDGFVVNAAYMDDHTYEMETGTMTFYDMKGKQTDVVEDCSTYVIGEHQGYYLLSEYPYGGWAYAYGKKEDVKLESSKERNRRMVYLYR